MDETAGRFHHRSATERTPIMLHIAVFAAVLGALYAAHQFGDHWVQRHTEALGKQAGGWPGRLLCARHVATLTATKLIMLAVTATVVHMPLSPLALTAGLAVDAVSHYVADRRVPLARIAGWLGKGEFWELGDGLAAPVGTGAYSLDQAWHVGWLWVTALIITAL